MHETSIAAWEHDHSFGLNRRRPGERRTLIVALMTAVTMIVEVAAGIAFGSMALLADGLHMASHATALSLAVVAYVYCRRKAGDPRFAFGTGKVNSLGGYTSALLLAGFALYMAVESVTRLMAPVPIAFDGAIISSSTLLDRQAPETVRDGIRRSVESLGDTRVAEVAVVSHEPEEPSAYKKLLADAGLAHVTVEVHRCSDEPCS